jgi:hypothetical protein
MSALAIQDIAAKFAFKRALERRDGTAGVWLTKKRHVHGSQNMKLVKGAVIAISAGVRSYRGGREVRLGEAIPLAGQGKRQASS